MLLGSSIVDPQVQADFSIITSGDRLPQDTRFDASSRLIQKRAELTKLLLLMPTWDRQTITMLVAKCGQPSLGELESRVNEILSQEKTLEGVDLIVGMITSSAKKAQERLR